MNKFLQDFVVNLDLDYVTILVDIDSKGELICTKFDILLNCDLFGALSKQCIGCKHINRSAFFYPSNISNEA